MGVYKAAVVTESGQNLIAQAFTSEKKLIYSHVFHPYSFEIVAVNQPSSPLTNFSTKWSGMEPKARD